MAIKSLSASQKMKKTSIGEIPVDWEVTPFVNITLTSQYGISKSATQDGNIPMLRMNNISDGKVNTSDLVFVTLESENQGDFLLKQGDLLFNRTNSIDLVGKTAIFEEQGPFTFASYLVRFSLNRNKSYPVFVNYFFNCPSSQSRLKSLATPGVSQYNINPTVLKKAFYIPLPSLPAQKRIAEILGTWDRAIERTEQLVQAKQKLKKGLMQQLLTGKRRFKEYQDEEWQQYRLGELFEERKETQRSDLPLLSITADRGVINRDELDKKDTSNKDKSRYLRIAPGDIGYNTMRMWQGVSAISRLEGIVSPAYTICKPTEKIDGIFAGYLFKFPPIVHLFWRYSQGLVNDTLSLKFPNFAQIHVAIPSVEEQQKIASLLSSCDLEIDSLRKKMMTLQQQKKGLMQKLLTGKIRVKV